MNLIILLYLFQALSAWALKPIEGVLLGEASEDLQHDPLKLIFSESFDKNLPLENQRVKLFREQYIQGIKLKESCNYYSESKYSSPWKEKQSRKFIASTLQYLGLDLTVKAIGAYAGRNSIDEADFSKLASNLVRNYCSKNLTVFSLKLLEKNLNYYYKNPIEDILPSAENSPFISQKFKKLTSSDKFLNNQFQQVLNNFRAFCSWGGSPDDYRLLVPYLKNPFIMSFVMNHLAGQKYQFDLSQEKFSLKSNPTSTVQVTCNDLICRRDSFEGFKNKFPLSLGSTGLKEDLEKSYCFHFSKIDYETDTIPEVKKWIKELDVENPVFETSAFLSLVNGFPDAIFGVENYVDLAHVSKSSFDERWDKWSLHAIKFFSKDLFFEEPLKIKTLSRRDPVSLRVDGFGINLQVTVGELDRVMDTHDKISSYFHLKLSKNYLRSIRLKWTEASRNIDTEAQKRTMEEIKSYIALQLKEKEKFFKQSFWNEDFERLIAEELLGQAIAYEGLLFQSYEDQMIKIPIKLSYGLFALNYIRYRADINAGRLKFKL
jgi:hypothetical protein